MRGEAASVEQTQAAVDLLRFITGAVALHLRSDTTAVFCSTFAASRRVVRVPIRMRHRGASKGKRVKVRKKKERALTGALSSLAVRWLQGCGGSVFAATQRPSTKHGARQFWPFGSSSQGRHVSTTSQISPSAHSASSKHDVGCGSSQ